MNLGNILEELSMWDWGVILLVGGSIFLSVSRGFSREAISLLGWVVAFVVANLYAGAVATSLGQLIDNFMARTVVSWLLLFVGILISVGFLAKLFSKLVSLSGLGLLDRVLGVVFGFGRGVIMAAVLVFLSREIAPELFKEIVAESRLIRTVEMLVDWSFEVLGSDITELLATKI